MKRTFLFMLMAIIMSLSGFSQEDYVEIGTQTTYDNVVPFNLYYNNSFSQCLYTAQELEEMGVGSITRIAYKTVQSVTPNPTVSVQIWMGETSNTTLSSATALTESDVELVYTGNVTITDDWFSIDLDNAYDYGGDNLVIIVKKNTQYINPYPSFAVSNANGTCIQSFDDNNVYDFSTLSSLNTYSYRPIVRLWAEVGGCPKAKSIVISDITEESANISWAENEDISDYKIMIKPSYADDDEWEELGTTSETYYELNGLESSTTYLVRIYSECDGVFEQYKEVSFATTTVPLDIPVEISFAEDGGWELINGSCANKWYIGTPSGYEDVSLFLSSTGTSATYNNGSVSNVIAERLVNMNDADSIHIEFDFIGSGESSYDYIKVFLMPSDSTLEPSSTANPTYYNNYNYTNMALDFSAVKNLTGNTSYPYMLNLTNNQVIRASGNILNPIHNGTAKLMITWRSDGSGGTTTPSAIINNIYIAPINCPAVSWSATPGSTTIDVEIEGEFAQVKLEYKNDEEEDAEWTEVYITESPYTIEDLNPATNYTIRVTNICDDDEESFVSTKHIQTTQIPATIPYSCDFTEEEENHMWITTSGDANNHWTIGTGTSIEDDGEDMALYISNDEQGTYAATSSSGYIYSYRLIDFGEDPVTARIELDAKCSGFHNAAEGLMYSATIFYLCDPALVPTSGFIDNSNRLGYVVSTEDWTHMTFEKQNISGVKALVCLTWGYSYNASCLVAPAAVDNIVVEASTCSGVVSFTAIPNEAGNIVLNWNTGIEDEDGDFVIRYRTDISEEMEQTYVNATGTTHELTDLEPATRYFIYIARVCGEGDTSAFRGPAIIITPCITLNELPYTCDFEGELNGQQPLPYCWNRGNTNTYPQVIDNISFAQSGTHSLYFSGDNIVILPKIDVNTYDISNLEVIFSCYDHNTLTKTFTVGTITDTSDVSTFEPVNTYTFTGTGSNTYSELVSISLAGYEGDAEFIALKLNSGDAYIDDIIVQEAGECSPVSSLSIDGELSIEEATLSWNGYAETYIVRYRTNNTDTWTEEQTNESSITLSDLAPITTYIVEVAPNCEEAIARRYTFTTPCAALTDLPYTCDFETVGTENNPLPACWTRGTVNTSNPYVINNSGNAHNSNRFLYIYGNNVIAALPPVSSSIDLSQTQITFYARHDGSPVNIEIGVMTDPTDMNTYTLVSSVNVNTNTYDFYEIPLSTYNGEGSYVVLKGTNSSNIYVDDITFEFIPACSRPANIEIEPLSTSAIISWTSTGEDFSVFYKQSFDSEYEEATNFESGDEEGTYTLTLSDLNESTSYDFYIVAHCDETNPQSVVLSFNTLQEPVDIPYATDFSGDEETGDRGWLLNNSTCQNYWVMGTTSGYTAMYVTNDGTTAG
ncbi:MAG: fibronectin type III domain-containing protein, partial [Bacteroidales bacterium]|nr:fibronectin type III domain-containing protein [Bacteroidales bacterium]